MRVVISFSAPFTVKRAVRRPTIANKQMTIHVYLDVRKIARLRAHYIDKYYNRELDCPKIDIDLMSAFEHYLFRGTIKSKNALFKYLKFKWP